MTFDGFHHVSPHLSYTQSVCFIIMMLPAAAAHITVGDSDELTGQTVGLKAYSCDCSLENS